MEGAGKTKLVGHVSGIPHQASLLPFTSSQGCSIKEPISIQSPYDVSRNTSIDIKKKKCTFLIWMLLEPTKFKTVPREGNWNLM